MKKIAVSVLAIVCVIVASSAYFLSTTYSSANVQLKGYDPVSYFVADAPELGKSRYAVKHDGVTYNFANKENRTAFVNAPEKFLPAYDGHCSYGVSLGQKFDIDPLAYRIVDGRLFLQLDPGTQTLWMESEPANIRLADKNWPQLQTSSN
jgi:YHS domain-containing protein